MPPKWHRQSTDVNIFQSHLPKDYIGTSEGARLISVSITLCSIFGCALGIAYEKFKRKNRAGAETLYSERNDLLGNIRRQFRDVIAELADPSRVFLTAHAAAEIITKPIIEVLLGGSGWDVSEHLDYIHQNFVQILAILIAIEWTGWPDYKKVFLDGQIGTDSFLPLPDLSFLLEIDRKAFDRVQYQFRSVVIVENTHHSYTDKFRLPFLNSAKIEEGAFGEVNKVLVKKYSIKYAEGGWFRGGFNVEVSLSVVPRQY
jgi:hypothetical protein